MSCLCTASGTYLLMSSVYAIYDFREGLLFEHWEEGGNILLQGGDGAPEWEPWNLFINDCKIFFLFVKSVMIEYKTHLSVW